MRKFSRAGIMASSAMTLLWLAFCVPPAQAEEADQSGLTAGHVLACDTAEEVEAVLNATDADVSVRLTAVNDHFGRQSCNIVTAIFYRGDEAKTVLVPDGIVRIVKVNMVGYRSGDAWRRMTVPLAQYVGVLEQATSV
jgi:hypothetical protein